MLHQHLPSLVFSGLDDPTAKRPVTISVCGASVQVVKRIEDRFEVLPRRWVVERTFGWLGRYRRLSKDYELLPEVSESMVYAAMVRLMLRRLAT